MHERELQEHEIFPEERVGDAYLIADDDEFFRVALKSIVVSKLGCSEVVEAGSLDEAMERLSETDHIDLAILDLAMPGMESAASLRTVRECFPETQIAVVSTSEKRSDILSALEAGAHGYVPKSLGVAEVSRALQVIREGSVYVPASIADLSELGRPSHSGAAGSERGITPRQKDVLDLLVEGFSNKNIARALNLSEGTIKVHVAALFRTLGVNCRAAAAVAGARLSPS